jgi:isoquinoline 1-oxidoreductase alpha subunit
MTAAAFLSRNPDPDEDDVNSAMRMNICRCGTYNRIRKGIMVAAKEMKNG